MKRPVLWSIILFLFWTSVSLAAVSLHIPEQVSGRPGGTVLVPVSIDDAIGIAGGVITLEFDSSVVNADEVTQTNFIAGFIFERNILDNKVRFAFANATGLTSEGGVLANITIRVHAEIEDGTRTALTLAQAIIYNESAETVTATVGDGILIVDTAYEFALTMPQGISLVHIPLVVSAINDQPMEIKTIRDFYDVIGPDNVQFLITRDAAAGQWRSYLGQESRGTLADRIISHDMGIWTLEKLSTRNNLIL